MDATASLQKICLLGLPEVGKTQIAKKYVSDEFEQGYFSSLAVKIYKRGINLEYEGKTYTIVNFIWDVPGSYLHGGAKQHVLSYLDKSSGIIAVYDCTKPNTVGELEQVLKESKIIGRKPIVFAANKADLLPADKRHTLAPNRIYASAKTGENIKELFELIDRKLLAKGKL
ncbi:MAG: ADP-ribosylation factor-like protein [DPANN group archaeon]|nr:ADP-ribosylation factor-like protein [DPANN group archaeon]